MAPQATGYLYGMKCIFFFLSRGVMVNTAGKRQPLVQWLFFSELTEAWHYIHWLDQFSLINYACIAQKMHLSTAALVTYSRSVKKWWKNARWKNRLNWLKSTTGTSRATQFVVCLTFSNIGLRRQKFVIVIQQKCEVRAKGENKERKKMLFTKISTALPVAVGLVAGRQTFLSENHISSSLTPISTKLHILAKFSVANPLNSGFEKATLAVKLVLFISISLDSELSWSKYIFSQSKVLVMWCIDTFESEDERLKFDLFKWNSPCLRCS